MEAVYTPVVAFARTLFAAMRWRITVRGGEHIPAAGPAVLASNHIGYLDFAFLGYGAWQRGRFVRFMAKKEVFDHWLSGPLMRGMGHLPVDRFGAAREAMCTAVRALGRGEIIGLFPEGTISRSFVPAPAKTGAARIAMEAGVALIPSAVWGSQRILTKGRPANLQRRLAITVVYGAPLAYTVAEDPAEVSRRLMREITSLVDEAARVYSQQPASERDRWWVPAHLGGTAPSVDEARQLAEEERRMKLARRRAERRREAADRRDTN